MTLIDFKNITAVFQQWKRIITTVLGLMTGFVVFNGCRVDHTLNPATYARIYIPQARNNPITYSIVGGYDSTQSYEYSAVYGGPGKPKQDIIVYFNVDSSLVDSFNIAHFTTYKMLPRSGYTLSGKTDTIPAGNAFGSSALTLTVNSKTLVPDSNYLLPITIDKNSGNIKLSEKLKTVYFLFKTHIHLVVAKKPSGQGTAANPYEIAGLDNLKWLSVTTSAWGSVFIQTEDIDASQTKLWNDGAGFSPIGNDATTFTGTYKGQDHTIKGLYISRPQQQYVGLFGNIGSGGDISKVNLTEVNVTGGHDVGGLAGLMTDGTIEDCEVSSESGQVTGSEDNAGGLIGSNYGTVRNAKASVKVMAKDKHIGGLAGYSDASGSISDSHATGNVTTGGKEAGGLVGANHSPVSNCYATGAVQAGDLYAGGLIGINYGAVTDCYATGSTSGPGDNGGLIGDSHDSVSHCYSMGNVTGTGSHANGGLVGYSLAPIEYSYATGNVQTQGSGSTGGLVGYGKGNATVSYCFATGDASTGGSYAGGLVGDTHSAISNSYATGNAHSPDNFAGGLVGQLWDETVTNCYATGKATSSKGAGGLVGESGHGGENRVTNSYWDTQTSGLSQSDGGGTGLATAEMQGMAAETNMSGFDFTGVWQVETGSYPTLRNNQPH